MKRLIWVGLVLGGLMLAGCGSKPAATATAVTAEAATATVALPSPEPTRPLLPTVTVAPPTPAATRTPAFTPTPTELPTPDPNLGVGEMIYEDKFDGTSGWLWGYQENDVVAFSVAGGKLNVVMKVGNSWPRISGGKPELQLGDLQLRVTATTNLCYDKDEYGVLFRANPEATDGYAFKLNCEGKARLEVLRNYQPTVLVDWTASPATVPNAPAENTLLVWAAQDQLHFYVNDKYVFSASDKTFTSGTLGFYIYDRTQGGASVSFSDLLVKAVTRP